MVTNDGALKYLEAVRQSILDPTLIGGVTVKAILFKTDFTPSRALTWADVSANEADFVGYARIAVAGHFTAPPAVVGGVPKLTATACVFTKTAGNPNQTILAWGTVLLDGGGAVLKLLNARKLDTPQTLTDASPSLSLPPNCIGLGL